MMSATLRDDDDDHDSSTGGGGWWEQPVSDDQHIRRKRLVLLHHAAKCPSAEGRCKISHCSEMKRVWKHIATCKTTKCEFPHCRYSRFVLSHYRRCTNLTCVICGPVRETDRIQRANKKRTSAAAGFRQDRELYCRLCLQEGEPLVRECSCRSDCFTHLSCIVALAENKIRQAPAWNRMMVTQKAFTTCPKCNEDYRGYVLRCDLLKARVMFVEREFKTDHMLYLHAMVDRVRALVGTTSDQSRVEGEEMCSKMLTVIEKINKTNTRSSNVFMRNVATAYSVMGNFSQTRAEEYHEKSREMMRRAEEYHEKSREIIRELDEMTLK